MKNFRVTYEIPPTRAIWTTEVEALNPEVAWNMVKTAHPMAHVRSINEIPEPECIGTPQPFQCFKANASVSEVS